MRTPPAVDLGAALRRFNHIQQLGQECFRSPCHLFYELTHWSWVYLVHLILLLS